MPGIVGLITTRPRAWAEPQLQRMLAAIKHEPFYTCGTWVDEASGFTSGGPRIAAASRRGCQSRTRRWARLLVFSGENYADAGAVASQARSDAAGPARSLVSGRCLRA